MGRVSSHHGSLIKRDSIEALAPCNPRLCVEVTSSHQRFPFFRFLAKQSFSSESSEPPIFPTDF